MRGIPDPDACYFSLPCRKLVHRIDINSEVVAENCAVFLVADACWDRKAFQDLKFPSKLVNFSMADVKAYTKTIQQLHELHCLNPELAIIPSHCEASINEILNL